MFLSGLVGTIVLFSDPPLHIPYIVKHESNFCYLVVGADSGLCGIILLHSKPLHTTLCVYVCTVLYELAKFADTKKF